MRYDVGRFRRPMRRSTEGQLMSLISLGDGSTLTLDFTTGVLDPRLTFTRASTGTYIGADGLVKTMAAAPTNDPTKARFDHDPTTLAPRGLLIEGSANNLLFWSESFATSGAASNWAYNSNTGAVVTTDNPAGGTTAFQFAETANSGPLQQSATVTNVVHTFSAWFKGSVYNSVTTTQVMFGLFTTGFIAGTASIVSGPGSTSVVGNIVTLSGLSTTQWTRVQFTTSAAIPAGAVAILIYPQSTAFEVNRSFHIWGAQLETGSGASSYIPTGASQGSRAYDHCYATGANFTSWFSVGAGTMVAVSDNIKNNTQNLAANISDDSTSNCIRMGFKVGGSANEFLLTTVGGPSSFQGTADSGYAPPLNTVYRMAYAWDTNNFGIVANGGAVVTDSSGTLPSAGVLTRLVVGGDFVAVPGDIFFKNGHIRSLKYWPTRLPNAQLQALTT